MDPANPFSPSQPVEPEAYQPPTAGPALTKLQRTYLLAIDRHHRQGAGFFRAVRRAVPNWILILVFIAAESVIFMAIDRDLFPVVFFLAGMFIGIVTRDVGNVRKFLKIWPAQDRVTDWRTVDELLESPLR